MGPPMPGPMLQLLPPGDGSELPPGKLLPPGAGRLFWEYAPNASNKAASSMVKCLIAKSIWLIYMLLVYIVNKLSHPDVDWVIFFF